MTLATTTELLTMAILTLNIDLDTIETVEGEGKFEGYTFLNSKKGRFTSIEATDADGNHFSLKTVFIRPLKTEKPKAKADSKTQQADVMAQMLDMMKSIKAENEAIKAELASRKPLTKKIPGLAQPAVQSIVKGTNGVSHG
jgi:hypothetical protein